MADTGWYEIYLDGKLVSELTAEELLADGAAKMTGNEENSDAFLIANVSAR